MEIKKNKSENFETENEKQNETSFYRLIFVGDNEVGKTQIINKYNNKIFQEEYLPTYSIDFQIKTIKIQGKLINIHCIDTQGSSDFSQDTGNLFLQKSDAFIYVFDITSRESFNNLSNCYEIIKLALTDSQKMLKEKIVYLVGNKCDLTTYRQINEAEGRLEATKYKAKYIEVSAKTGINIDKLFDYIIQDIAKKDQDSTSFDSGGGIIHKNIFNNNKSIIKYKYKYK
jgi:small GTP-binding protein